LFVAASVLGGCGGGDGDTSSTIASSDGGQVAVVTTSMTKPQYAAKAQRVCVDEISKIATTVQRAIVANSKLEVEEILPELESMYDRLVELGAPQANEQQARQFLGALRADIDEAQQSAFASTNDLARDFRQSGTLAQKAGIEACRLG
jgi:phage-related protein